MNTSAQIKVVAARLAVHHAHALGDVWPNNETSVLCVHASHAGRVVNEFCCAIHSTKAKPRQNMRIPDEYDVEGQ
jgi:hypothetical protein